MLISNDFRQAHTRFFAAFGVYVAKKLSYKAFWYFGFDPKNFGEQADELLIE